MNVNIYLLSRANGSEVHYYDLVNLRDSLTGDLEGCALSWFSSTVTVAGVMRRRYVIGSTSSSSRNKDSENVHYFGGIHQHWSLAPGR